MTAFPVPQSFSSSAINVISSEKKQHFHSDFQQKQFISPLLLENDIFPSKQTEKGKFVEQVTQEEEGGAET